MNDLFTPQMVDADWFARFRKEFRMQGATGREIGEALASVDEYCRSSGQRADEAFGDPVAYAASLGGGRHRTVVGSARLVVPAWLWLVALLFATDLPVRSAAEVVPFNLAYLLVVACEGLAGGAVLLVGRLAQRVRIVAVCAVLVVFYLTVHSMAHLDLPDLFHAPVWAGWLAFALTLALLVTVLHVAARDRVRDPRSVSGDGSVVPARLWPALPWLLAGVPLVVFLLRWAVAR